MNASSALSERARGLLIGAAVGDALGWPQEQRSQIVGGHRSRSVTPESTFRGWTRYGGGRFARYEDSVHAGEYSDDTQLLLAVARACAEGRGWLERLTSVELPVWPLYERGGGRAVLSAALAWQRGTAPWLLDEEQRQRYFAAGANGVAMRIGPHSLITAGQATPDDLFVRVVQDGITTHGHPRAIIGGVIHALALRNALTRQGTLEYGEIVHELAHSSIWRDPGLAVSVMPDEWTKAFTATTGQSFENAWMTTVREVDELIEISRNQLKRAAFADDMSTLKELGCFDSKRNGSGTITAVASAYLAARAAAQPITGLLRAAFLEKADTDTLASMVASTLGAIHGTHWMNGLATTVQDREYMESVASFLTRLAINPDFQDDIANTEFRLVSPSHSVRVRSSEVRNWTEQLDSGWKLTSYVDGRKIAAHRSWEIPTKSNNQITRHIVSLQDGQTLFVDRIRRIARVPSDATRLEELSRRDRAEVEKQRKIAAQLDTDPKDSFAVASRIAIATRDLERSIAFYQRLMGPGGHRAGDSYQLNQWLVLIYRPSMAMVDDGDPRIRVTLDTPLLSALVKRLDAQQMEYSTLRVGEKVAGIRMTDPDGNELFIRQNSQPE